MAPILRTLRLTPAARTQIRHRTSILSQHTFGKARESAGESKRSTANALEKTAGLDIQSEYAQAGLEERREAAAKPHGGVKEVREGKGFREEFPNAPGTVIGMEDERGQVLKGVKCEHEGARGSRDMTEEEKRSSRFRKVGGW